MKIGKLFALLTIIMAITYSGCGQKSEISAPRQWTFQMEKVWEIQKIGEDRLLRPAEPRIADDGTLYFHDFERHLSYIINRDGNLVGTFAGRGSNKGEVQFYINCFPAGDYIAVCTPDKIHFFNEQGEFIKAVKNNVFVRFPLAFKNRNEFWAAPGALGDAPGDSAVVTYVNLAIGEEKTVYKFARSDLERRPTGGALVLGLTPQIKMGYDPKSDEIYYGKNSDTIICRMSSDGGKVDSFAFTATKYPVSETDKKNQFAKADIPEDVVASLVDALPDQMCYYNRIQIINGLIYLISAKSISDTQTGQDVDIYSPDGRHLYYGRIQVEEGWHIISPDNLQLGRGIVYAVQENDSGDRKIVKYRIALPQM